MGGFDDDVAIVGDWVPPPSSSSRAFFSALLDDEFSSRPITEPPRENKSGGIFPWSQEQIRSRETDAKDDSGPSTEQKMNLRGGLLERRAARAGFNAPRLDTESIRPADLSHNPDVRSSYLTIPPGLSPTTLLESPVFLSNSLVQPSPTTGKFPFAPSGSGRHSTFATEAAGESKDDVFEDISTSSFSFKPAAESGPSLFLGPSSKITSANLPPQNFPGIVVSVQPENALRSQNIEPAGKVEFQNEATLHLRDFSRKDAEHLPPPNEQQDDESDQRGDGDTNVVAGGRSDDGYNWRKYGQKQVKGSEYPRSYFKCTHTNCPVKKKVERAHDGHITEIIYKGAHNHTKSTPNRGIAIVSDMELDSDDQVGAQIGADGDPRWTTVQNGTTGGAHNWRHGNLEVTSSASMSAEYCNAPTNGTNFGSSEALDVGSNFSNDEEEEDRGTHGSISLGCDGEGDEYESKKRKIEDYATEMSGASRAVREPRVVVQTTSEVDILDDGYRWRKYGQKVVKGNPNPRSYYKCTSTGCNVRKHVERASHDLKSVITTYEGKHNHNVPAARNGNSVPPNNGPAQSASAGSVPARSHRPEPCQPHSDMGRFDCSLGLSSLGLPARQQMGLGPHTGFSFGMNQPRLANLAMAGLGSGQGKPPVMPYFGQQRLASEGPKLEPLSEPPLNLSDVGSSVYHQIMSRLPLGPQM